MLAVMRVPGWRSCPAAGYARATEVAADGLPFNVHGDGFMRHLGIGRICEKPGFRDPAFRERGVTGVGGARNRLVPLLAMTLATLASIGGHTAGRPASMEETVTFFYYEDLAAQVPFYEDLLGLEKTMDEDWVKIYRITPTSSVGLVLQGRGFHAVSADKPAMLSIVTDDVDAWYRRLVDADVRVRSELPPPAAGQESGKAPVRGFVVEDPGGYTIEFFSWRQSP